MYEIVDNLPIPHLRKKRSYPFRDLKIGQCFLVDCEDKNHERSVRSTAHRLSSTSDSKYTVRRIPETDTQIGVWRTE